MPSLRSFHHYSTLLSTSGSTASLHIPSWITLRSATPNDGFCYPNLIKSKDTTNKDSTTILTSTATTTTMHAPQPN
ncbi:hypothetical protein E2C01_002354 [Portunus trituberculatus]|uniref:Uncharacterized protein n=1 Tax=Portunus trituberculatus TaxID=210409 RepID=A0A5B7CKC7_PORTR|nr:hypothetical protein [Portunus trituberculatus]